MQANIALPLHLVRPSEVARALGVRPSTVMRWIETNKVEHELVAGRKVIVRASLQAFLGSAMPSGI